jgi:cell division protein FtsW (lipid II flippase)
VIRALRSLDRGFVLVVAVILALGLYNLASASKPLGASLHWSHASHILIGLSAAGLMAWLHYRNLETLAYPILLATVVLLVATMFFGRLVNGSRRWLSVGFMSIQTSDLAKVAVIIVVAKTFHGEPWSGALRLRDVFRPLNVSRPTLLLAGVLAVALFGDALAPAKLQRVERNRPRTVAQLSSEHPVLRAGRGPPADLRIRANGVSPEHAQVVREANGRYVLTDLGSEAGTFVNDQPIEGPTVLRHGDTVRFGTSPRAQLRFSARLLGLRPFLPWLGLLGVLWTWVAVARLRQRGATFKDLAAPIDVVMLPSVLILVQPDLGTTLVVLLIAFSMILFVGLQPRSLLMLITGSGLVGVLAWFVLLKPYQKERVVNFLNPNADLAGAGYHQHQSLIAVGSGEMWGKGHGQGTQTQLSFLPEQQTDFIFSVWAEEQGFVGCALVVVLFAGLMLILLNIGLRARDRFGCLLVVGVTAMLFWHAVINMLMVLRLAPVVGVPLPLWSNGGSFVLTTMLGLGLVASVDLRRRLF